MARQQRLLITFSDRAYNSLKAFSDASGIAAASLVSQLVEGSIDSIDNITDAFTQVNNEPSTSIEYMLHSLCSQSDRLTIAKGRGSRKRI
jgi:hypothetical protein